MSRKISSKKGEELRMIKLLKELENKMGKLIPLDELYPKSISIFFSGENVKKIISRLVEKEIIYIPREGFVMFVKKPTITPDLIEADFIICRVSHKGIEEPSTIFCDKIEYMHDINKKDKIFGFVFDHHLMFWNKGLLVFKVWLPNETGDKEFKDIFEAMESCGIKCNVERK